MIITIRVSDIIQFI